MALDRPIQIEAPGATSDEIEAIILAYQELWPEPVATTTANQQFGDFQVVGGQINQDILVRLILFSIPIRAYLNS